MLGCLRWSRLTPTFDDEQHVPAGPGFGDGPMRGTPLRVCGARTALRGCVGDGPAPGGDRSALPVMPAGPAAHVGDLKGNKADDIGQSAGRTPAQRRVVAGARGVEHLEKPFRSAHGLCCWVCAIAAILVRPGNAWQAHSTVRPTSHSRRAEGLLPSAHNPNPSAELNGFFGDSPLGQS